MPHWLSPVPPIFKNGRVNVAQTLLSVLLMLGTRVKPCVTDDDRQSSNSPQSTAVGTFDFAKIVFSISVGV